jgi:hypothetical protein
VLIQSSDSHRGSRRSIRAGRSTAWRPRTRRATLVIAILSALGLLVVVATVAAIVELISPDGDGPLGIDERCGEAAFSCGIVGGLLISIVPIVIAVLSLLVWRLRRVRDRYRQHAADHPEELVEAAMSTRRVVGRDGLCTVIQDNLQAPSNRRPYVVVGGVGVGKTAVLVRLTELLAERGAVPVPIRLREAQQDLDFMALARRKFLHEAAPWLASDAEGDTVWRRLFEENRIVVLADGLEEALMSGIAERSRDTAIRLAFAAARDRGIPLVVTARPHDALRYLDAAMVHLEPLSEGAAHGFISGDEPDNDPKVHLIVERAEVVEAPLYMQIGRDLHTKKLLRDLDTRETGRLALRMHLLDTWLEGVVGGVLDARAPYTVNERRQALEDLEALAILGLTADTLEVRFAELDEDDGGFRRELGARCSDVKLAATVGDRLGIVEAQSHGIRFRHSIMQAYLGSLRVGRVIDKPDFVESALKDPGREMLMALVMHSFRSGSQMEQEGLIGALLGRARELRAFRTSEKDVKALDVFAAALEIASMASSDLDIKLRSGIEDLWVGARERTVDQAKLRAVARLNDLGGQREPGSGARRGPTHNSKSAYRALLSICLRESCYPVRLAAAQALGAGGSAAFGELRSALEATLASARDVYRQGEEPDEELQRSICVQGWILPLLAASAERKEVLALIRGWIDILCERRGSLSAEASWAQGFKYEANRKLGDADISQRVFLAEQAERLLEHARFWFSRVSLLHAFTLWSLDTPEDAPPEEGVNQRRLAARRKQRAVQESARRIVSGWNTDRGHPFVAEAATLCERTLETRTPGRYIWIDEFGVASKLGPQESSREHIGNSKLWISSAAGWLALDPRARQLVGDIVVALNLIERSDSFVSDDRIQRAIGPLPPCIADADGRRHLQAAGHESSRGPRPGSTCAHRCRMHLCPYPRPGDVPFRGELNEAFCLDQQRILDGDHQGPAPWQRQQRVSELKEFWSQMETRTRL